jgi:hypothetical protein
LSSSQGDILEDEELINTLASSQSTSNEINDKVVHFLHHHLSKPSFRSQKQKSSKRRLMHLAPVISLSPSMPPFSISALPISPILIQCTNTAFRSVSTTQQSSLRISKVVCKPFPAISRKCDAVWFTTTTPC